MSGRILGIIITALIVAAGGCNSGSSSTYEPGDQFEFSFPEGKTEFDVTVAGDEGTCVAIRPAKGSYSGIFVKPASGATECAGDKSKDEFGYLIPSSGELSFTITAWSPGKTKNHTYEMVVREIKQK